MFQRDQRLEFATIGISRKAFMEQVPLVTIAIPTFNRASLVLEAVMSARNQTYRHLEILISDNASSDFTFQALNSIEDPRVVRIRQPRHLGMVENWNACLKLATGKYFLLLSDDDKLMPQAIEGLLQPFVVDERSNEIGISYCRTTTIDESGQTVDYGCRAPLLESAVNLVTAFFRCERTLFPCSVLMRTEDIRQVGGYPAQDFDIVADAFVWLKLVFLRGHAAFVDKELAHYRSHSSNLTKLLARADWIANVKNLISEAEGEMRPFQKKVKYFPRLGDYYLARTVSGLIIQSLRAGSSRWDSFRDYYKNRKYFSTVSGVSVLLFALLKLLLPVRWIAACRRIRSASA